MKWLQEHSAGAAGLLCGMIFAIAVDISSGRLGAADPAPPTATATATVAPAPPAEGHLYMIVANHAYASSLRTAASSIRSGGAIAAAQAQADKDYSTASRAEFAKRFAGPLGAIVPEGKEPTTQTAREAYAKQLESIAAGVDEVK